MALVKCPECSNEISNTAKTCPHCGLNIKKYNNAQKYPNRSKNIIAYISTGVIILVIICIIAGINSTTDLFQPSKVTYDEFLQIHKGMSYEEVCDIIGIEQEDNNYSEHSTSSSTIETIYTFEGVGSKGCEVKIYFINNKVEWKMHTGLTGILADKTENMKLQ